MAPAVAMVIGLCQERPVVAKIPTSDAAGEAECRHDHRDACSEAMGRWLPQFGFDSDCWDHATRVEPRDRFLYERESPLKPSYLAYQGPVDGTPFVFGNAGPAGGRAVDDPVHHVPRFAFEISDALKQYGMTLF